MYLIDADEFFKNLTAYAPPEMTWDAGDIAHKLDEMPRINAEPIHYGFIICGNKDGRSQRIFSCCNTDFTNLTAWMIPNYCPNCGAKILVEGDSSNE